MSKYSTYVEVHAVRIITNSKQMGILPIPHTCIIGYAHSHSRLVMGSTLVKWTTSSPSVLQDLHASIVNVVQEVGFRGMMEITARLKMTEQVLKRFGGGVGSGIQEWVEQSAAIAGVSLPMPASVLKYLKGVSELDVH